MEYKIEILRLIDEVLVPAHLAVQRGIWTDENGILIHELLWMTHILKRLLLPFPIQLEQWTNVDKTPFGLFKYHYYYVDYLKTVIEDLPVNEITIPRMAEFVIRRSMSPGGGMM